MIFLAEGKFKEQRELNGENEGQQSRVFDRELFFPKPSNEEQRRIVEKLKTSNGVLVQGPPGTGKSHTIANLICHLLATGQSTLITAKAPRALHVLEGLIPENLRELCINLLGTGVEELRSLETSVSGILRRSEEWDEATAEQEKKRLEEHLKTLRGELVRINRQLRDIRESETRVREDVGGGKYRGTAARIAETVNRDKKSMIGLSITWLTILCVRFAGLSCKSCSKI